MCVVFLGYCSLFFIAGGQFIRIGTVTPRKEGTVTPRKEGTVTPRKLGTVTPRKVEENLGSVVSPKH